ncbi:MAG TPA: hypothetical protein DD381_08730 [Lentisphaeria bacterium]|nr:MAG: hypothetical protein A2X47_08115 [Lentisphaerae bacterium GWF2_38_69]HBM16408.1 hypothetical protein [Lentisphaeria bacterium]
MTRLILELPESAFSLFHQSLDEFLKSMKIAAIVKWYEEGKISQSKAAEIACVTRQEFLEALYEHKIPPFQITPEELGNEIQ